MKKILLVIEREYLTRVKKKSFIITTVLVPILFAALMFVPALLTQIKSDKEKNIVVLDNSGLIGKDLKNIGTVKFENRDASLDELKNTLQKGDNFAILYVEKGDSTNVIGNATMFSEQAVGMDVTSNITAQIKMLAAQIKLKEYNIGMEEVAKILNPSFEIKTIRLDESGAEKESHTQALSAIAMVCGILIFFVVFMFGVQVMRGVIEEKSNRIIEVIISSIKPMQLMLGKIIGVALVVITQVVIWLIVFGILLIIAKTQFADVITTINSYTQDVPIGTMVVAFVIYLILGYLLYASIFAIIGSAVDNETDTQQLQSIATIPLMIGYFIMFSVAMTPDSPLAFWGSMIPFTSPIVMLARIPFGVPVWQIVLSVAILIATFLLFTWLAARIYRVGILMYGKKASFKEIIKWINYKS